MTTTTKALPTSSSKTAPISLVTEDITAHDVEGASTKHPNVIPDGGWGTTKMPSDGSDNEVDNIL